MRNGRGKAPAIGNQSGDVAKLDATGRKIRNRPDQRLELFRRKAGITHRSARQSLACSGRFLLRFPRGPDLLLGQIGQDSGEQEEAKDRPTGLLALVQRRFGRPDQEGRHVLRHLVDRRLGAISIGHLTIRVQRRRHRDVEVREIRVVVQARAGLRIRELLDQFSRLVLITGQQRIDIGRAFMASLGHQRQIGRHSIVVGSAGGHVIGEGLREEVRCHAGAHIGFAGVRINARNGQAGRFCLHFSFGIAEFRKIADEVGAKLWVDMAHFAGLVAAGLHPNPVPFADVVSTTVHKTLAGPRSGLILSRDEELAKKLNSAVFPGQQGGPLMHVIAAKATAFKLAMEPEFKDRQQRTLRGAQIIADRLTQPDMKAAGVDVLTGGTEVHLVLVDLRNSPLDGQQAEDVLHASGITVNRNSVPFDPRPPMVTSGLRIGTPALATRGFGDAEFTEVADVIAEALKPGADVSSLKARVKVLTEKFPLYPGLEQW